MQDQSQIVDCSCRIPVILEKIEPYWAIAAVELMPGNVERLFFVNNEANCLDCPPSLHISINFNFPTWTFTTVD